MEIDNVTRIYGIKGPSNPDVATILSPADQAEQTIKGPQVQAIFERADFRLIPYTANTGQGEQQGYYVYRAPFTIRSDSYNLVTSGWRVQRDSTQGYQRLPQELQRRTHEKQPTKGLTIVVFK